MTRQELIDTFAAEQGLTKREAEQQLDALVDIIERTVEAGDKVSITGFGVFDRGERAGRRGVNPRTGETITIPAMQTPRFHAGKRFKERLR